MHPYHLIILNEDAGWAREIEAAVRSALVEILLRDDLLKTSDHLDANMPSPDEPTVVLYLGDTRASKDERIASELEIARRETFSVVPIRHSASKVEDVMPAELQKLQALAWESSAPEVVLAILEQFGLAEKERKLFLSYRRVDTEKMAVQLCHALSERRFDVFLDRFSVPPAADFQKRIDVELSDKAFVLVLESRSAVGSPWVQHEVSYALGHHISVLALTMPDAESASLFEVVDEAFRFRLSESDLTPGEELTADALGRVLELVELRHARQVRRRRSQLLGSAKDWLFQAGYSCLPVDDWALLAERSQEAATVFYVTARSPQPADLRQLDELRRKVFPSGNTQGVLVHQAADRDENQAALMDWIVQDRPLTTSALDLLPAKLGL